LPVVLSKQSIQNKRGSFAAASFNFSIAIL
jgi:hypothetical protein